MRTSTFKLLNCIFIIGIAYFIPQNSLLAKQENYLDSLNIYITGINSELLSHKCLPGWKLERKKIKWIYGREYLFASEDNSSLIFLTVSIHASNKRATEIARSYMNDVSTYFKHESRDFARIGDSAWFCMRGADPAEATNIVFVRNNALIILGGVGNTNGIYNLANEIDDGILNKEQFVTIDTVWSPPEISSFQVNLVEEGKSFFFKVVINTIRSNDDNLEYQFAPGIRVVKTDSSNEFKFYPPKKDMQVGLQSISAILINQNNSISEIKELDVKLFFK